MLNSRRRGDSDDDGAAPPVNRRNAPIGNSSSPAYNNNYSSSNNNNSVTRSAAGASSSPLMMQQQSAQSLQRVPLETTSSSGGGRYTASSMMEPLNQNLPTRWVLDVQERSTMSVTATASTASGNSPLQLQNNGASPRDSTSVTALPPPTGTSITGSSSSTLIVANHTIPLEYLKEVALKKGNQNNYFGTTSDDYSMLTGGSGGGGSGGGAGAGGGGRGVSSSGGTAGTSSIDQMLSNLRSKPFSADMMTTTSVKRSASASLYPTLPGGDTHRASARNVLGSNNTHHHHRSRSSSPNNRKQATNSPVYYFEVTVEALPEGSVLSVGMVVSDAPATIVARDDNDDDDQNTSSRNIPGNIKNSIGLTSRGELYVSGRKIDDKKFALEGAGGEGFLQAGDVIGCGLEVLGTRRILFTKNGTTIIPPTRFQDVDPKNYGYAPALGMVLSSSSSTTTTSRSNNGGGVTVVGNFGSASAAQSLFLWERSEVAHIVNTALVDLNQSENEQKKAPVVSQDDSKQAPRNSGDRMDYNIASAASQGGAHAAICVAVGSSSHALAAAENANIYNSPLSAASGKNLPVGTSTSMYGSKTGGKSMLDDDSDSDQNVNNYRTRNSAEYQEPHQTSLADGLAGNSPVAQQFPAIPKAPAPVSSPPRGREASSSSSLPRPTEAPHTSNTTGVNKSGAKKNSKSPTRRLFGFGRSKKPSPQEAGNNDNYSSTTQQKATSGNFFGRGKKKSAGSLLDEDDDDEPEALENSSRKPVPLESLEIGAPGNAAASAPATADAPALATINPSVFGTKSKKGSLDDDVSTNTDIKNHMAPVRAQSAIPASHQVANSVPLSATQSAAVGASRNPALFGKKSKKSSLDDDNPADVELQSALSSSFPAGIEQAQIQGSGSTSSPGMTVAAGAISNNITSGVPQGDTIGQPFGSGSNASQALQSTAGSSFPSMYGTRKSVKGSLEDDDDDDDRQQQQTTVSSTPGISQSQMVFGKKSTKGSLEDDDDDDAQLQSNFTQMPGSTGNPAMFGTRKSAKGSLEEDENDSSQPQSNFAQMPGIGSSNSAMFGTVKSAKGNLEQDENDSSQVQSHFAQRPGVTGNLAMFGTRKATKGLEEDENDTSWGQNDFAPTSGSTGAPATMLGTKSKKSSLDDDDPNDIELQANFASMAGNPSMSGSGTAPISIISLGSKSKRGSLEDDEDDGDNADDFRLPGKPGNQKHVQSLIPDSNAQPAGSLAFSLVGTRQTTPVTNTIRHSVVQAGNFKREPSTPIDPDENIAASAASTGMDIRPTYQQIDSRGTPGDMSSNLARPTAPLSVAAPSSSAVREPSLPNPTNPAPRIPENGYPTAPEGASEEELLNAAIEESKRDQEKEENTESSPLKSHQDLESIKENARTLRSVCSDDSAEPTLLEGLLSCCRDDQKKVQSCLESEDPQIDLMELLSLNELVMDAIKMGETLVEGSKKRASTSSRPSRSNNLNLDIAALVQKKDIFSLICILRAQSVQRLDAAVALMDLASEADNFAAAGTRSLRDEIRSSGGMHSLVTVFRSKDVSYELRVVAALAVAYVLPSFVESSSVNPSMGLKIMECLRFLSTCRSVSPNGRRISREESYKAAAMGVTSFWMNEMTPMFNPGAPKNDGVAERSDLFSAKASKRLRKGHRGGQRHQSLEFQELLEMTVSLIVQIERLGESEHLNNYEATDSLFLWKYTNVEQVCAVDVARPIAVREGLLPILIGWIRSKDREKVRPAISALRYLTSIEDKYMAGWIHSQMVNEGALAEVVKLADDYYAGQDVRLAVAQILASLCVAPHTRAAVVEAKCINYLIGFLYDHSDKSAQEIAFYAGSAVMQLAEGAITRADVLGGGDMDQQDGSTPDKADTLVDDICNSGAIGSFISIAANHGGKLRSMAIEAIRVLSEDTSPNRRTRSQLCEEGAAEAIGHALKDDVKDLHNAITTHAGSSKNVDPSISELHDALCALANMLEPVHSGKSTSTQSTATKVLFVPSNTDPTQNLFKGCIQTAESGGLDSLLWIASLPLTTPVESDSGDPTIQYIDLLEQTCRSLASLSPLLLTKQPAAKGYSNCTGRIFDVFDRILKVAPIDGGEDMELEIEREALYELNVSALRGMGALATAEPLKIRIVDKTLPILLQMKNSQSGRSSDVSNVTGQVLLSLGFEEDEIAVQVAGSNPHLLADWFCLQRSLLIQAMARSELRRLLLHIWKGPFANAKTKEATRLLPESSISPSKPSELGQSFTELEKYFGETDFFENFVEDDDTEELRSTIVEQYQDFYDSNVPTSSCLDFDSLNPKQDDCSLLARHVYPLNKTQTEIDWILSHAKSAYSKPGNLSPLFSGVSPPEHVSSLLDCCFPSRLLRDNVVPIFNLAPEASFNFRALTMPQRRYFSFRREGQLISRLCDKQAEGLDSDVHWTLGFVNSTFAGEFSETLVQALYLCPTIHGLTFATNEDFSRLRELKGEDDSEDDGSASLASLVGSLPPWIHSLTFRKIFSDTDVKALVSIIETMGKLSSDQANKASSMGGYHSYERRERVTSSVQAQGKFRSFAICSSPAVSEGAWYSFFSLLGRANSVSGRPVGSPLSTLKVLDLSFNNLGDETSALLLELIHDPESGCTLEQLDLSGNGIRRGASVVNVLRRYVEAHRYNVAATVDVRRDRRDWQSSLHTLNLSSNELGIDRAGIDLVSLLKNNLLALKTLDLSDNGFGPHNVEYELCKVLVSSIVHNTLLYHLNLSSNAFSSQMIDTFLGQLAASPTTSCLAFLGLDNNAQPLTQTQRKHLETFLTMSRQTALQRYLVEKGSNENGDLQESENLAVMQHRSTVHPESSALSRVSPAEVSGFNSATGELGGLGQQQGDNMITVLFSAPLVFTNERRQLKPFAKLDFEMERELLWQCMKEASRDIELYFDNATHDRLLSAISKRCSCLHYSGHGHPTYLPFEDGGGGPNWFKVEDIQRLITRESAAPFKFVFVSACHSGLAGETFASAGVPHVVCCQQEFELKDTAALAFTRQFYLSLVIGHTVRESFEQGCKAVRATPNLREPEQEMKKFLLLPKGGNHDIPIFNARAVSEWPKVNARHRARSSKRGKSIKHISNLHAGGSRSSELSVRNMMQEDPSPTPPQFFLGREVEMYYVLKAILSKRLVSVVAETGVGRSSLVCALCHYINERASTIIAIERIYFVKAKSTRRVDGCRALMEQLLRKLIESGKEEPPASGVDDMEDLFDFICKALKNEKALVVFDRMEYLEGTEDADEFPMLLSALFRGTKNVKVIVTGRRPLGIPSLGGQVEYPLPLGPLTFENTVRLFANLCPHLHTAGERHKLYEHLVTDGEQSELRPSDAGISERTKGIFKLLGDGIPSKIEMAAYEISNDTLREMLDRFGG